MARTIGTKWINKIKKLVDILEARGMSGVYEITEKVKTYLPPEVWDIWESADSEIDRVVNDYVMSKVGHPFPKSRWDNPAKGTEQYTPQAIAYKKYLLKAYVSKYGRPKGKKLEVGQDGRVYEHSIYGTTYVKVGKTFDEYVLYWKFQPKEVREMKTNPMHKAQYKIIAEVLAQYYAVSDAKNFKYLLSLFAEALWKDNNRFDPEKFTKYIEKIIVSGK